MTRYSPIIGYLLVWQLLMPLLCFFASVTWWVAALTAVVFIVLLISHDWERNSYSTYSGVSVIVMSLALTAFELLIPTGTLISFIIAFWLYAQIAYTATSPYPLSIRMPLIIYTLAFIYMIPVNTSSMIVIPVAFIFSSIICYLAIRWRGKSKSLTITIGPPEPPYSFSLATAIVSAVAINLILTVCEYLASSIIPELISLLLLSLICIWLLCANDWNKNILAVAALVLMITSHIVKGLTVLPNFTNLTNLAFILSIAPVMFHTTAPVFRGMRIVITLFAVYSALNRHSLIIALTHSPLQFWQQHAIIIAIDAISVLTLLLMAVHWKKNI